MTTFPTAEQITDTLTALPEAQRAAVLEDLYTRLDHVADRLKLPQRSPSVSAALSATDRRPRAQVWAPRLNQHHQYAAMPGPVCEHILHSIVNVETHYINQRLNEHLRQNAQTLTGWSWDPATTTATRHGTQPGPMPHLDAYLNITESILADDLDTLINRGFREWIINQAEFLFRQGWTIDYTPEGTESPEWALNPEQKHLVLRMDLSDEALYRPFSLDEMAQFPALATALIQDAATTPDPVSAAFPAAAISADLRDAEPAPTTVEHQEGPVR
jgi:hypothetical protein